MCCDVPGCASLISTAESRQVTPCRLTQCDHRHAHPHCLPLRTEASVLHAAQSSSDDHNTAAFLHATPDSPQFSMSTFAKKVSSCGQCLLGGVVLGDCPQRAGIRVKSAAGQAVPSSGSPRQGPGAGGEQGRGNNGGASWRRPAGRTGCIPAPDIGAGWGQAPRAGLGGTDVKYVNKGGRLSASSLLASPPQAEYMPASPPPGSLAKTEDRRSQGPVLAGGGLGVFLE